MWERNVDEDRFQNARVGDMLCCVEFQCNVCWFLDLKKEVAQPGIIVGQSVETLHQKSELRYHAE